MINQKVLGLKEILKTNNILMDIHLDKIIPIIIAIVLIYLNTRKKNKKVNPIATQSIANDSTVTENKEDTSIFNPIFQGLDDIINFNNPENETIEQVSNFEEEEEEIAEEIISQPTRTTSITNKLQEQPFIEEYFEFDFKKAIIYSEIMNRKYFSL